MSLNIDSLKIDSLKKSAVALLGLCSLIVFLVVPIGQAHAAPVQTGQNSYFSDIYSGKTQSLDQFDTAQLEAIEACLPQELTASNEDIGDRFARAFGEMGNDFLERAFNLEEDPTLSDAEIAFRSCLKSNGAEFVSPVS